MAISVTMGTDGTNYYFAAKDVVGDKTATTWSPDKGTKMEEFIPSQIVSHRLSVFRMTLPYSSLLSSSRTAGKTFQATGLSSQEILENIFNP